MARTSEAHCKLRLSAFEMLFHQNLKLLRQGRNVRHRDIGLLSNGHGRDGDEIFVSGRDRKVPRTCQVRKKHIWSKSSSTFGSGTFWPIEERVVHQDSWSFKTTRSSCVTRLSSTRAFRWVVGSGVGTKCHSNRCVFGG